MPLDEPGWWYGETPPPAAPVLRQLARAYAWAAERRLARTEALRAPIPVVCIGNFTAGGTGKTPLTIAIVERLIARGHRPVILTRGYGGRIAGPHLVVPSIDTAADVGDEPLLLARHAPVMVARDRRRGAEAILASALAATAIVMDDGLQNPSLAKDLAIAVVDGRRGVGNGEVIPLGPLRAPLEAQLARTDAIVVNRPQGVTELAPASEMLRHCFPGPVLEATTAPAGDVAWLQGTAVTAFAGIANPQRFFGLLESLGARIVTQVAFKDHHTYGDLDAERLLGAARTSGGVLVTTEKDAARLVGATGALARLAETMRTLPVRLVLDPRDEVRLDTLLGALPAPTRDD